MSNFILSMHNIVFKMNRLVRLLAVPSILGLAKSIFMVGILKEMIGNALFLHFFWSRDDVH